MSQTETLMLLALGVFATLFLVLLFGRGLWALLGRWSGWKEARKVPRTIRDLRAERDGLKAEKAMMASKLENSMSDMKLRLAEQMAEVSRNRNRLLDANGKLQLQSNEIDRLKSEVDRRDDKIGALSTQIEENVKAISQAWAKTAEHESGAARAVGLYKEAVAAVDLREDRIRNLEGETKALREIITAFLPGKDISKETHSATVNGPLTTTRGLLADVAENVTVLPEPAINAYQSRFGLNTSLEAVDAATTPQPLSEGANDQPTTFPREATAAGPLEQGISNVLSLAERVRVLQKGIKK